MPTVSFCPKCGAAVKPDFEFCTSCGLALAGAKEGGTGTTPPQQPVPEQQSAVPVSPATPVTPIPTIKAASAAQPVKSGSAETPLFTRQVHIIIIALILAGLGVWIYTMESGSNKGHSGMDALISEPGKDKEEDKDLPIVEKTTRLQAEDFAGTWRAYETNNPDENNSELGKPENDLFIEVSNGSFSLYPRSEKDKEHSAEFTCGELAGNTISCSGYSKDDGENFTLKMEMHESKNDMTMTISPEKPTEMMILKLRRL